MNKKKYTFASICTSAGVYETGLPPNIKPIWGVEIDPEIASAYSLNHPKSKIIVSDACKVDWSKLPRPDLIHASPSCRNFSQLNNKVEAAKDIAVAQAVGRAIAHFLPQIFTLENVSNYAKSESWTVILNALNCLGYSVSCGVERLKFWGIPQKQRNRFIAIATYNSPSVLLMQPNRTNYWYECIQDLIPDLKPSPGLTETQIKYLPRLAKRAIANKETVLLKRNQIWSSTGCAYQSEPYCWTPTATIATDQRKGNRPLFADLVTKDGIFSLSPRCLARIQTIPDSYILPESIAIAATIAGDAVPPLFVSQMWEQILNQVEFRDTIVSLEKKNCSRHREKLETIIDSRVENLKDFYAVGMALIEIRDDKLYKPDHTNFYSYCSDRFPLSQPRVKQLIRAVKVRDSVSSVVKEYSIDLVEGQCRELNKIKDVEMRSQVLTQVAESGSITAKAISIKYREMKLNQAVTRTKPDLPPVGAVIRLTTKSNPELKHVNGYWAIVTAQHEYTCEARGLAFNNALLSPYDFVSLDCDIDANELLDRLATVYNHPNSNDAVRAMVEAIATRPYPILEPVDDLLLRAIAL